MKLFKCGLFTALYVLFKLFKRTKKHLKHNDKELVSRSKTVKTLSLIGEQRVPHNFQFNGFTVGGFSGIDYDPKTNQWVLISDDSAGRSTACLYKAKLNYDHHHFYNVKFTDVHLLKQKDGSPYKSINQYKHSKSGIIPDFESVRFDPLLGSIWYTNEGDRKKGISPFIRQAKRNGQYLSDLRIPNHFKIAKRKYGVRDNLSFEASTFTPDGEFYLTSTEAPLYQDGRVSSSNEGSYTRLTKYHRSGTLKAEYAYPVSSLPIKPDKEKEAETGISEILAINTNELLVLERSSIKSNDESYHNEIRLFKVNMRFATDISHITSLQSNAFIPVTKKLILDFNTIGLPVIDNLEGITWGPKLSNGHDSLVLVSDNNFNSSEVTQFLAFDVIPESI